MHWRIIIGWVAGVAAAAVVGAADKPKEVLEEAAVLRCLSWVKPVYPKEAIDQKREGAVSVRFIVDETGAVTKARVFLSNAKVFEAPAVQAVLQWRFVPVVEEGHPVAKCVDATLPFELADLKERSDLSRLEVRVLHGLTFPPRTKPVKKGNEEAEYPDSLLPRHVRGEVVIESSVSPEGTVRGLKILMATHADFVRPALNFAEHWTFRPAMQGDLPVAAPLKGSVDFTVVETSRVDLLAANHVTLAEVPAGQDPPYDREPEFLILVDPVYPRDLLLSGTAGTATVDFVINADGRATAITVRDANQRDFGRALAAALEGWVFRPAHKEGAAVPVKASWRWEFNPAADAVGPAVARLIDRLRGGDTEDMGARGLDTRLNPRFQVPPAYPEALRAEKPEGQAMIEFLVDREGRGRLARVVSATREEFGWAAATAVNQWVFDPPRRGGLPVDLRVSLPFQFSLPR
jgi:TonB family protein